MEEVRDKILRQIDELEKTLFGMRDVIKIYILSKACDLTVLLLGAHATAKSALSRMWSTTTGLNYRIVTSSEVDESLIAYIDPAVFREKNIVQMRRGELMEKNHIIVDEYFLWLNKYRAKLHQLLEEKTYAGLDSLVYTYTFLSNPLSDFYAGQIPEINMASIDRIDLFVPVNQPSIVPAETMMRKFSKYGRKERPLSQISTWEDYLKAREEIMQVKVPSKIIIWLTLFAHSMASCKHVKDKWSLSTAKLKKMCLNCNEVNHLCSKVCLSKPRFLRATILLSKGLAWLNGRDTVTFQDINEAILYTLPHRLAWIQEELSYSESLEKVHELVQQFNDDMLVWKNRGVFSQLAKIIESSKSVPPKYEDKIGQELSADVSEIHILKEFITETLNSVKEDVSSYYFVEASNKTYKTLKELEEFLEKSGLSPFERDALAFKISPPNLSYIIPNNPENIEKLIDTLINWHTREQVTIDDKTILERKFSEAIIFDSELVKIQEETGSAKLLFPDEKKRNAFVKLWEA